MPESLLKFPARQQVKELLAAPQLDVGVEHHCVIPLHQRVEELVQPDGIPPLVSPGEVVPHQELLDGEIGSQVDDLLEIEFGKPLPVVPHLRLPGVEDPECLLDVGAGVCLHLLQ